MIVGFAGAGNMAAAMARGWGRAEGGPGRMLFTDAGSGRAHALAEEVGGEAIASNRELAEKVDLLVLAVKPGQLEEVAAETGQANAVLSMLGATSVGRVAEAFPAAAVMRLMPNLGVEVGRGVMCFAAGEDADAGLVGRVRSLLEPLGRVVDIDDSMIDAATAVMGCSPAYFALVVEAVADAGTAAGIDADLSLSLVVDSAAGTAETLRSRTPAELRAAVASPGGSTEAGLEALDRAGAVDAFRAAVEASLERMRG
jgi:pyrroline-5-carboxylate reductase